MQEAVREVKRLGFGVTDVNYRSIVQNVKLPKSKVRMDVLKEVFNMNETTNIDNTDYGDSLSSSLRRRSEQHSAKNDSSKEQEHTMIDSISETISYLESKYPQYKFGWEKKIKLKEIYSYLSTQYNLPSTTYLESVKDSTFLTPDGGFIYVVINYKKYYILVGEQKTQGTNDKRLAEGKKKQALGNAVERLGKNYNCLDLMFSQESILPFVTFLQGCDFHESETIPERVVMVFKGLKRNTINLNKDALNRAGSYYMRGHKWNEAVYGSSDWNKDEVTDIFIQIAEQSLSYYIQKYNK
jgi:type II restriction enzyme